MNIFDGIVTYSGWIIGLLSFAYIGVERIEIRRERAAKEQLATLVARASAEPVVLGADSPQSTDHWQTTTSRTQRIRAALVKAAAGELPLRTALRGVQSFGGDEAELIAAAENLEKRGLLEFESPPTLDTVLRLKV